MSMTEKAKSVSLVAVGDVAINRDDPQSALALARPIFETADVTFANCESTYARNWSANPAARGVVRSDPEQLGGLSWAGVDVVSFANNHHLDAGYEASSRRSSTWQATTSRCAAQGRISLLPAPPPSSSAVA